MLPLVALKRGDFLSEIGQEPLVELALGFFRLGAFPLVLFVVVDESVVVVVVRVFFFLLVFLFVSFFELLVSRRRFLVQGLLLLLLLRVVALGFFSALVGCGVFFFFRSRRCRG